MFQDGYTTDNDLTISGGDERTTFYLSGGYNYDRGIVVGPNNHYRRIEFASTAPTGFSTT